MLYNSTSFFTYLEKINCTDTTWTYKDCIFIRDLKYALTFKDSGDIVAQPIIDYTNINYKTFLRGTYYPKISFDCLTQTYFLNSELDEKFVGVFDTKIQILEYI